MEIKRFPLGQLWTNCYLVWSDNGDAVVVDPGGDPSEVIRFIEDNDLSLKWVLLTHGHGDHIGGVSAIRGLAEHGVAIHAADAGCLTNSSANLSGEMGGAFTTGAADRLLSDGDELTVGGMKIKVIHTPGHTPGGCSFDIGEGFERYLLCGDTLFARSVGRSDLPGGDEKALHESLVKLSKIPAYTPVYPGHGPETTIGEERDNNPFWPR